MGAANVGLQKAGIQADLVASLYGAQTGQAQRGYTRQLETVAANKAASDAVATGIGDVTGTVGQLGLSAYMAYNQIDAAKAADIASGAFNYEKAYGPATYGSAKPGWGNFDYGV